MKIATLSDASAVHTVRWVEFFRSRGHEVRAWSMERAMAPIDLQPLPRPPLPGFLRYALALPALERALAAFDPDVVDAHYVPNYGVLGALSKHRPLVVTAWGSDLLVSPRRTPFHAARTRFVMRRANLVLADSGNLGAAARAYGAPPDRVRVVPWGVDLGRFAPRPARQPGLLVSTRRHEPVYDLPTLIHGVKPVLESHGDARLVIVGDGTLTPALERLAAQLLPAGRYRFTGRLDAVVIAEWLGRAAVYLSASLSDSTSLSLLEAMASGAVPVVSDLEANREWVLDGEGAAFFTPGDVAGASRAIARALDDAEFAEHARRRNRAVVEARADWGANMRIIESMFEALARGRPLPDPANAAESIR
jgi:glycosyltransferase involved in cell wall biosynthesis